MLLLRGCATTLESNQARRVNSSDTSRVNSHFPAIFPAIPLCVLCVQARGQASSTQVLFRNTLDAAL